MFNDIGSKIKRLAEIVSVLGILASIILGIVGAKNGFWNWGIGFLIMICGILISWLGCFFTYGFGDLIETENLILDRLDILVKKDNPAVKPLSNEQIDKLLKLQKIYEEGNIDEETYNKAKRAIINSEIKDSHD